MAEVTEHAGEMIEEEKIRANTYALLGVLLTQPPGEHTLTLLRGIDVDETDQANAMGATWKSLNLAAHRRNQDQLNDEYHDLFIGVARGEVVPYGSWYLTGFLMDRPLAKLRQDLDRLGIKRSEQVKEPEDHAGALCESMSLIVSNGENIGIHTQKRFFDDHIASWMGKFFEDLQSARSADFYRAVGALGEQFLEVERQYLGMSPH